MPRRYHDLRDPPAADVARDLREGGRSVARHRRRIARHDAGVGADLRGETGLAADDQIGLRQAWTAFAWQLFDQRHKAHGGVAGRPAGLAGARRAQRISPM
jgi:hypothetical protein